MSDHESIIFVPTPRASHSRRDFLQRSAMAFGGGALAGLASGCGSFSSAKTSAARAPTGRAQIGYTEFRTSLPAGRHANNVTMRACVIKLDGTGRRVLAKELSAEANSWTQFAGWSPDG